LLLAHELTHVLQQGSSARPMRQTEPAAPVESEEDEWEPRREGMEVGGGVSETPIRVLQCGGLRVSRDLTVAPNMASPSMEIAGDIEGNVIRRNPDKRAQAERRRQQQIDEMARDPAEAHRKWKKLSGPERLAVLVRMEKRYGASFSEQFLAEAIKGKPQISQHHFGRGVGPKPDELIARGFRHGWNQFIAVDMENEWWVHPSGRKISRDISTWKPGETQPERAKPDEEQPEIQKPPPPPEGCKELSDVTLSILRDTISTETAVQVELEGVKSQLEKLNKTADDYPQHYNQYIESLEALKGRLATTADDIETMRDQLTEMNCPVSLIDSQLQELMDLQIWVDIASGPRWLGWWTKNRHKF